MSALALALVLCAAAQQDEGLEEDALEIAEREEPPRSPLGERPLQNDVFLPVASAAQALLASGDASLARAGELAGDDAARARGAAFEDWFGALEASAPEGSVPAGPAPGELTEGAWAAVVRRLEALAPEGRAAWRERFEPAAQAALAGALSRRDALDARLLALERSFPATRAAWSAALGAAELALEAGHETRARGLLARAERLARLADDDGARRATGARAARLAPPSAQPAQAWEGATRLEPRGVLALPDPVQEASDERTLLPQRGVRPGLAWLSDERAVVQSASRVHEVDLSGARPRLVRAFSPQELVGDWLGTQPAPHASSLAPGWGLAPAVARGAGGATLLVLTLGRAVAPAGEEGEVEPNALVCVALEDGGPRLRWAVSGAARVTPEGERTIDPALASEGGPELQPAPRVAGSLVLVAARESGAEERAWLLAFDLETGAPVWRRLLAQGADLSPGGGRFGSGPGPRLAAPAPLVLGERVFAGTTLGAGALVDLCDGRPCWALAIRRRATNDPGWSGTGPLPLPAAGGEPALLWDPVDSDVLYRLRGVPLAGPEPRREDLFAGQPHRIDEAEGLVGGDADGTLLLARAGAARGLVRWGEDGTDPLEALHLAPRERFRGAGLAGAERALAATERGVYLFDRARELYLLDYAPLAVEGDDERGRSLPGGELFARGARVVVLGRDRLWAFAAR